MRTRAVAPTGDESVALARKLRERTRELIRARAPASTDEVLDALQAEVTLGRIDEHHCVVCIEVPKPEHADADAATIGTVAVLQGFDGEVGIEDLQGLPRSAWFFLQGP